jgi:hypothetical protein
MLSYCNSNCSVKQLGKYRAQRWREIEPQIRTFFFEVGSLMLYSAANILYELFPSSNYVPDEATIASFFGAQKNGDEWEYIGQRAPPGWKNRVVPYDLQLTDAQIGKMYQVEPVRS